MKTGHGAAGSSAVLWAGMFLAVVFLSSCDGSPRDAVAKVNDHEVTVAQAKEQLRALLWRNGETWEDLDATARKSRQHEAAEACMDQYLLETFAAAHPAPVSTVGTQATKDFQQFLKQFEPPDEWQKRAALQGLTTRTLKKQVTAETEQALALEMWLAAQTPLVTEAEARRWYEAHRATLQLPERVRASEIFLTRHDKDKPDRSAELAEISLKLKANQGTFAELAAQYSEDDGSKQRGGDMGWFSRDRMPPEFAEKVFALPVGQLSGPIESHLGWHFVIVLEKRLAREAEFAEMKEEITALLDSQWREEKLTQFKKKLRDAAKLQFFEALLGTVSPE